MEQFKLVIIVFYSCFPSKLLLILNLKLPESFHINIVTKIMKYVLPWRVLSMIILNTFCECHLPHQLLHPRHHRNKGTRRIAIIRHALMSIRNIYSHRVRSIRTSG